MLAVFDSMDRMNKYKHLENCLISIIKWHVSLGFHRINKQISKNQHKWSRYFGQSDFTWRIGFNSKPFVITFSFLPVYMSFFVIKYCVLLGSKIDCVSFDPFNLQTNKLTVHLNLQISLKL